MFTKEVICKAYALLCVSYGRLLTCHCILYSRAHASQGWCLRVVSPHSRGRVHCNQGTLPGLECTFLNGFFPKVGFFRSFSYPRDAPFHLLLVHDLNVNKAVTVSTKAPLHQ